MAEEAWLSGKLEGYTPIMMPAAHALVQAAVDLEKRVLSLSREELIVQPNGAPSAAFHLRHITGSIDRLLTYSRGEDLSAVQFDFLKHETAETSDLTAEELVELAKTSIENALEYCKNVSPEILFDDRFVGRKRLPTTVFGLLFHIAEHTARHVGQVITTTRIVRNGD